jgi:glycine C-acetyltransferase
MAALAQRHQALLMTDECHATGFMGKTGRGIPELAGARVDIVSSTLGKGLGGATGGYIAGPAAVVAVLRQRSRPYLFSNSVAPCVVGASIAALQLVQGPTGGALREQLRKNVAQFRKSMTSKGFTVGGNPLHPICPIMIGDAAAAQSMAAELLLRGVYVIGFSYPVVPVGKARIRVQISAAHTADDIDLAVDVSILCVLFVCALFILINLDIGICGPWKEVQHCQIKCCLVSNNENSFAARC